VSDVGFDGLANLLVPVGLGIDCRGDALAESFDVGAQQLQEALFLAGEVVVERALGSARVAHDVGDGGGTVAALADRSGEAVEQPAPKRVWLGQCVAEYGVVSRRCHRWCHGRRPFR